MLRPLFLKAAGRSMALTHKRCAIAQQGSEAKRVGVADVVYKAIDSFVAKYEAETELEKKIIRFRRTKTLSVVRDLVDQYA